MNGSSATHATVRTLLLGLVVVAGLTGFGAASRSATAQEGAFFPAYVLACDAYVEFRGSAAGFGYPPECRGLEGVTVTAYDTLGDKQDSCRTDSEGVCRLAIGYNGTRIFEQSTDAIPDGYRAESDVQRTFTYTEFAEIAFHNYREDVLPQRDAGAATVRVHSRECPLMYEGDTFFDDCDSGIPQSNQWIFGNDQFARAGSDGDAILRDMPAATDSEIIGGQSFETGDIFFYCSMTADASVRVSTSLEVTALYDGITRDFVGKVELEAGDDVTCDWYQIPFLDRGLWDTVYNPLSEDDPNDTTGNVTVDVIRCDEGFLPVAQTDVASGCKDAEVDSSIQVLSEDGSALATAAVNSRGRAELELTGMPLTPFTITLAGHDSTEQDLIVCNVERFYATAEGGSPEPLMQLTVIDGAGWTIPGYGDDVSGIACVWYLAPVET